MWWLELILIGAVAYMTWRLHLLEQHIEALEKVYNELADIVDKLTGE